MSSPLSQGRVANKNKPGAADSSVSTLVWGGCSNLRQSTKLKRRKYLAELGPQEFRRFLLHLQESIQPAKSLQNTSWGLRCQRRVAFQHVRTSIDAIFPMSFSCAGRKFICIPVWYLCKTISLCPLWRRQYGITTAMVYLLLGEK